MGSHHTAICLTDSEVFENCGRKTSCKPKNGCLGVNCVTTIFPRKTGRRLLRSLAVLTGRKTFELATVMFKLIDDPRCFA